MITKQDCLLLLSELKSKGVDTNEQVRKVMSEPSVSLEVLKFINDNRSLDIIKFYEKLRKSYNNKKSILYKNIVKELDETQITDVLTTLASLQLQILLFAKNVDDQELFFNHARLSEISACLLDYSRTYSLINCINLLRIVKADMKALESISR